MEIKELTIESLMIGDWVYFNDSEYGYIPVQIEGISHLGEVYVKNINTPHPFEVDSDLQPIPITEEILAKYGFKKKIGGTFELVYNPIGIYIRVEYNPVSGHISANDRWFIANEIHFVHELQHALKMSKVNKEIEL